MTAIEKKYQETGGASGFLGAATTGEISTPGGSGIYNEYQHGIIYYSADYGACVLREDVVAKWKSASVATALVSDNKTTVRDYLGFPVSDTIAGTANITYCYFERGMIACYGSPVKSFVVYGSIYLAYRKANDVSGWMGFPASDEQASANGGRVSHFQHADVYWHPNTGAFEVHGAIRDKYNALGGSGGLLGYPISDESDVFKNGTQAGRLNNFEFGTIYWSGNTGAFEMHGGLLQAYTKDFGGPAGELGFPVSDEQRSPKDHVRFNNFQNGVLTYNMSNGNVRKVTNLKVVCTRLQTDEDDDDLLVKSDIKLTIFGREISSVSKQFGEYSNTGTKSLNENEGFIGNFPVRDGNAVVNIHMKAWDVDSGFNFGDDEIGSFTKRFDIDTFWDATLPDLDGNTLQTKYNGPDGNFKADLRIEQDGFIINVNDKENFRKNLFWDFHNPKIAELGFEVYADTFSDVEADDGPVFHPFNHIFYQAAYKTSAKTGTCFGMCLEAVYALKGRSASREPISQYSFDEQRRHDISVKFGYQLGGSQIVYLIDRLKSGDLWNPVNNFNLSKQQFDSGNYPILCLSKGTGLTGGHAVLPYDWDTSNPNEWIIRVANPNSPVSEQGANTGGDRVIRVNPVANTFSYDHSAGETWSGGKGLANGGRLFSFPYSELSSDPRTPFWEVMATLLTGGMYLIFAGDAQIEEITDGSGAVFYDDKGKENANAATRIKKLIEVEPLSGTEDFPLIRATANLNLPNFSFRINGAPKSFYFKDSKAVESMYAEEHQHLKFPGTLRTFIGHTATAAASTAFAPNLNKQSVSHLISASENVIAPVNSMINLLMDKSLTFDIRGSNTGEYNYGISTGKSQVIISANAGAGVKDRIIIDGMNTPGQAITFKAIDDAPDRKVKMTVISSDKSIRYELSNINVAAGKAFTLQHNDACRELIMHNGENAVQLDVQLFLNGEHVSSMLKQNIEVAANSVIHFEPVSWGDIKKKVADAPVKLDFYNHLGGEIINSVMI